MACVIKSRGGGDATACCRLIWFRDVAYRKHAALETLVKDELLRRRHLALHFLSPRGSTSRIRSRRLTAVPVLVLVLVVTSTILVVLVLALLLVPNEPVLSLLWLQTGQI